MWPAGSQVTKVGPGQKLGDNAEAVPFSDMTVEDLLRIVRSLPPEESAVAAVSRGLFYLDSRALAALLKELHKVGLSNRCTPCTAAMLAAGARAHRTTKAASGQGRVLHRRRLHFAGCLQAAQELDVSLWRSFLCACMSKIKYTRGTLAGLLNCVMC